jgi:hypothetical protein
MAGQGAIQIVVTLIHWLVHQPIVHLQKEMEIVDHPIARGQETVWFFTQQLIPTTSTSAYKTKTGIGCQNVDPVLAVHTFNLLPIDVSTFATGFQSALRSYP